MCGRARAHGLLHTLHSSSLPLPPFRTASQPAGSDRTRRAAPHRPAGDGSRLCVSLELHQAHSKRTSVARDTGLRTADEHTREKERCTAGAQRMHAVQPELPVVRSSRGVSTTRITKAADRVLDSTLPFPSSSSATIILLRSAFFRRANPTNIRAVRHMLRRQSTLPT